MYISVDIDLSDYENKIFEYIEQSQSSQKIKKRICDSFYRPSLNKKALEAAEIALRKSGDLYNAEEIMLMIRYFGEYNYREYNEQ